MQEEPKKFIVDVVPLTKISASRQQFFSYLHHSEIPAGSLVSIPLFRRNLEGVVLGSRSDFQHIGNYELKRVTRVINENCLTPEQIKLAELTAEFYAASLGIVLKSFVPKIVKERTRNQESGIKNQEENQITLTSEQASAVNEIFESHSKLKIKNSKFLLYGPASSGKTEVYIHAILKLRQANPDLQFLILLPELTLIEQALERYGKYFTPDEIALLHSKVPKGQLYTDWQKIQSGQAKIIIGTRMAAFAPFKNLGLIILDEEQDISFKQWDSSPRYDVRVVAEKLAEIFSCPLVFGSATPRIETFYKATHGNYELLLLPQLELPTQKIIPPKVEVVDMRKEKWTDFSGKQKPNESFLSRRLQEELSFVLSHGLQAVLFINHQGMNSFSICTACKTVLRCPNCDRALVYNSDSGEYSCLHCSYTSGAFATCKNCQGMGFKNVGIGTQAVQREVKKLFHSAKVCRADRSSIKNAADQKAIYVNFQNGDCNVLIGTQMITKGWDLPSVALVGIIDADALLTIPDFYTDERAFQNIVQSAGRTARLGSKYGGTVLIQTYDPNNLLIKAAAEMDFPSFYASEIEHRKDLFYPPMGRIIKILFQDKSEAKVEKETEKIYTEIKEKIATQTEISVSHPHNPLVSKQRGKHKAQIIIRLHEQTTDLHPALLKFLQKLGSGWIVDIDPISIV